MKPEVFPVKKKSYALNNRDTAKDGTENELIFFTQERQKDGKAKFRFIRTNT